MLELKDLHTYYGDSYILQGVSLNVSKGEVVALFGRNGVGKTTTLRSIMGLTPPCSGKIIFDGDDISKAKPYMIARKGIGYVPEDRRVFSDLTVVENLNIGSREAEGWTIQDIFNTFPTLAERKSFKGRSLSGGEQQILSIARALMGNPRFLILDEPTEGLAPLIIAAIEETIRKIKNEGITILLVAQNMEVGLKLADRYYIMSSGKISYEGSKQNLKEDEEILKQHLMTN